MLGTALGKGQIWKAVTEEGSESELEKQEVGTVTEATRRTNQQMGVLHSRQWNCGTACLMIFGC